MLYPMPIVVNLVEPRGRAISPSQTKFNTFSWGTLTIYLVGRHAISRCPRLTGRLSLNRSPHTHTHQQSELKRVCR
jgi:hypothetical protein